MNQKESTYRVDCVTDEKITLHPNYESHFTDVTLPPFEYHYNESEEILGHKFVHIRDGIFRPEPIFSVPRKELNKIIRTYRDLVLMGYVNGDMIEVHFALSKTGCSINWIEWEYEARLRENPDEWKWWDNNENSNNRRTSSCKKSGREWMSFSFPDDDFYVVVEEEVREAEPLPEKKEALNFRYERVVREDGIIPRIMLGGFIGDMVEPGIYYFPKQKSSKRRIGMGSVPELSTMSNFGTQDVAVVAASGWGISTKIYVYYLALDRKYFKRLKEIGDNTDGLFYMDFSSRKAPKASASDGAETEESALHHQIPTEAIPLMDGLGMENVELYFDVPLVKRRSFETYEYAYRMGETLVLVYKAHREGVWQLVKEEYNMRLMTHLEVKKSVMLHSGYEYEVIHKIIDCQEEKYKEILSPQAYALYQRQWEACKEDET